MTENPNYYFQSASWFSWCRLFIIGKTLVFEKKARGRNILLSVISLCVIRPLTVACVCDSSYSCRQIILTLHEYFCHDLKMCIWFYYIIIIVIINAVVIFDLIIFEGF